MKESWDQIPIYKPRAIVDYNMYMLGVDLNDQLQQYYSIILFCERGCTLFHKCNEEYQLFVVHHLMEHGVPNLTSTP